MGIIWHVPGFSTYKTDDRPGDAQFFKNGNKVFVIDGYCGSAPTNRLIADLKLFGANKDDVEVRAAVSHWHYDHYDGIRKMIAHKTKGKRTFNVTTLYCQDPESLESGLSSNAGSGAVRDDIRRARKIIAEAKAAGIKIVYLQNEQEVKWGDIHFINYRIQPTRVENDDNNGWAYMNDGSLCFWFPELRYLTTGDGPEKLGDLCKKYGLKPLFIKGPHHGNCLVRVQATILWNLGCRYYWDNDRSKGITDFLQTGREDAQAVGMRVLNVIGDINGLAHNGKFHIYKNGRLAFSYKCPYDGRSAVTQTTPWWIVQRILRGTYGEGDRIISYVIARGYAPAQALRTKNKVVKLAKDILSGKVDYGREEERWARIDKELGPKYGKLVQAYINVLAGVQEAV